MKNKILIVGHIRSGHHFLGDSIGLNSKYYHDFIWLNINDKELNNTKTGIIYKNHGLSMHHENYMDQLLKEFHIFVPIRDGRDVMTSTFFFKKSHTRHKIPENMGFQDFLRFENCTYIKHWVQHVESWLKKPVHIVRYEDMFFNFNKIMKQIFEVINEDKDNFKKPKFGVYYSKNNIQRKGIVGDYKNYFTKEDEDLFWEIAKSTMLKLGY